MRSSCCIPAACTEVATVAILQCMPGKYRPAPNMLSSYVSKHLEVKRSKVKKLKPIGVMLKLQKSACRFDNMIAWTGMSGTNQPA